LERAFNWRERLIGDFVHHNDDLQSQQQHHQPQQQQLSYAYSAAHMNSVETDVSACPS